MDEYYQLPKLSSDAFTFTVDEVWVDDAKTYKMIYIELRKTETNEVQIFTKHDGAYMGYLNHMNSLTDDLCNQWFEKSKQDKASKVKKTVTINMGPVEFTLTAGELEMLAGKIRKGGSHVFHPDKGGANFSFTAKTQGHPNAASDEISKLVGKKVTYMLVDSQ